MAQCMCILLLPPTNDLEWSVDHILELEYSKTGHWKKCFLPLTTDTFYLRNEDKEKKVCLYHSAICTFINAT